MSSSDIWKYCTPQHVTQLLLSLDLFQGIAMPAEKQIACLYELSNYPQRHYTAIRLPKKNGSFRQINAPDFLLKTVQRNLLRHDLEQLPVSPWAAAYRKDASVAAHASIHVKSPRILKLDIQDFFPNITFAMVYRAAFSPRRLPPAAGVLLTSLCCLNETLPQGSPASPCLSNLVMKPFDDYMGEWCRQQNIRYSRYCDDLTFSGDFDSREIYRKARGFLDAMGFSLNREKTRLIPAGRRQTVTGVVINEKAQVGRDYRRQIRQEVYYCGKYGVTAHLRRTFPQQLAALQEPAALAAFQQSYLRRLLGRIQWVLTVTPQNREFSGYREQVKGWCNSSA